MSGGAKRLGGADRPWPISVSGAVRAGQGTARSQGFLAIDGVGCAGGGWGVFLCFRCVTASFFSPPEVPRSGKSIQSRERQPRRQVSTRTVTTRLRPAPHFLCFFRFCFRCLVVPGNPRSSPVIPGNPRSSPSIPEHPPASPGHPRPAPVIPGHPRSSPASLVIPGHPRSFPVITGHPQTCKRASQQNKPQTGKAAILRTSEPKANRHTDKRAK